MATLQDGYELLHRGTMALAEVEHNGMCVDVPYIHKAIKRIDRKIEHFTALLQNTPECKEWKKKYGPTMNLSSNDQLGDMLYNELKFPISFYTDSGRPATNQKALEALEEEFEQYETYNEGFLDLYFRVKKYGKAKSTYLLGTLNEVVNGFIHPSFTLHNVRSMRSGCNSPNVQNQCNRNKEIAKIVRKMYIPRAPDRHIVEIDYSTMEVRVGCIYHKDKNMVNYMKDPHSDMHRDIAIEAFMLPEAEISKSIRQATKGNITFPAFYGSYYPDMTRGLWDTIKREDLKTISGTPVYSHLESKGITEMGVCNKIDKPTPGTFESHIARVEKKIWEEMFPDYDKWRKKTYNEYTKTGRFHSILGYIYEGVFKRNDVANWQIQGHSSMFLIWSICELLEHIRKHKMQSYVIAEVHDSIIADVPTNELAHYVEVATDIMTNKLCKQFKYINVPIVTEADVAPVGRSWAEKEAWV